MSSLEEVACDRALRTLSHIVPKQMTNQLVNEVSAINSSFEDVVIVSAVRTPTGCFNGTLSSLSATKLGSIVIKEAVKRAGLQPDSVEEVIMGNVLSANLGQAPARQAAIFAGLPTNVPCTTVNKVCASGMKAVSMAAQAIMCGQQDCIVAGGFESMSNVPFYLDKARNGYRYGHGSVIDGLLKDGLWDCYNDQHMGDCAEDCSQRHSISRGDQDQYAINTYKRAIQATKDGVFKEIVPVEIEHRGKVTKVVEDEQITKFNETSMAKLKPSFQKDGTVTAANASPLSDGASALVLMSASKCRSLGLKPLARIKGFADAAVDPLQFTDAPTPAVNKLLEKCKLDVSQIDYFELNEAFSVVSLANMKMLNLDPAKVNVFGGAVALGHALGSSGSRILSTLIQVLHQKDGKLGVAAICNGGGGASAICIEKL